jgi:hypothetical protein
MAVQFKSPTDKIKRVTGFQWTEEGVLVLDAAGGFIYSTEDGDEFTERGRGDPSLAVADDGQTVVISKITYHAEQEAFYAATIIFTPTEEDTPHAGGIIRSIDGGETWQSVYRDSIYDAGSWIAYDDENERLSAVVSRQSPPTARHLRSSDGLTWATIGESTTAAGLLAFMFAETITCELADPQNPSQHFTAYVRMSQPNFTASEENPRLTTVELSRNRQTWTTVDTGLNGGTSEAGVRCLATTDGGGVLIAVGGGGIAATLNGTTWSRRVTLDAGGTRYMHACGFVGDQFIAIGEDSVGWRLWFSEDGFDWESVTLAEALDDVHAPAGSASHGSLSSPFTAN